MKSKFLNFVIYLFAIILGFVGGAVGVVYITLPDTEELIESEEVFYSYNESSEISHASLTGESGELSFHFLELGNKYTGDCTYIKIGDIDILIDCGSKSNSISTVSNYLNNYVTDNTLEFVIVTHAHLDHYAGFATSAKIQSIFDLYNCETIIDFGNACNQKSTATMYNNYLRELGDEVNNGAKHFSAIECWNNDTTATNNDVAARKYSLAEDVTFEILDNLHYRYNRNDAVNTAQYKAKTENDYSVCTMFSYGEKKFLFTGDLEDEHEQEVGEYLISNNPIFNELKTNGKTYGVELYKAGHHGSKTSSSSKLLECIRPKVVCVCCCAGSSEYTDTVANQFPTQEFIDRIAPYTSNVYVTTLCLDYDNNLFESMNGNIVVILKSKDEELSVNCSNNTTVLKDTDWFKKFRQKPGNW